MRSQRVFFASERILLLWLIIANVFAVMNAASAVDFYVSVDGDAQADGSLSKPFGSLPEAVEAVRALRKAGNIEPAVIYLREGRHQLDQTLVLGLEDGSPKSPDDVTLPLHGAGDTTEPAFLTFAAHPGEHPIVSGGVPVTGWKPLESAPAELPVRSSGQGMGRRHSHRFGNVLHPLRCSRTFESSQGQRILTDPKRGQPDVAFSRRGVEELGQFGRRGNPGDGQASPMRSICCRSNRSMKSQASPRLEYRPLVAWETCHLIFSN